MFQEKRKKGKIKEFTGDRDSPLEPTKGIFFNQLLN